MHYVGTVLDPLVNTNCETSTSLSALGIDH